MESSRIVPALGDLLQLPVDIGFHVISSPLYREGNCCVDNLAVVTPRFPNNVNNTDNQSIQRKTECHTTFKT